MPGHLVQVGATVICAHGGQAQPTAPNPRVTADGQAITTLPAPWTVAGCSLPPVAGGPDVTAQFVTSATRVLAGGMPVLLQDSQSICAPSGTPGTVVMTQLRVKGI